MRKVAIIGIGETKFGPAQTRTNVEMFTEAAMDAIKEATA